MATFRFNHTVLFFVLFSLACISREGSSEAASGEGEQAKIQKLSIEHVTPSRDYVGKLPSVLEWTPASGVDSYSVTVENEVEVPMLELDGLKTNSVLWPKELKLDPGTYFWRIIGMKGDRSIADSGRAAFLVREP